MPHYEVIPVDKHGNVAGPIEIVASRKEIPAAKARIREKHGGKARQKFDIFQTDKAVKGQVTPKPRATPAKPARLKTTPGRNVYSVTPVNKFAHADGPTEKADGRAEIPAAKKKARERLGVKRHRFDVYNESKKKFVDA
jgi:hypothetical protein